MKHKGRHRRGEDTHNRGAKTFRRGRAISFLERLEVKRDTLKKQLETPELQSINPILVGELKAIEMIIDEYIQVFDLHECDAEGTDLLSTDEGNEEEKSE